jgi:hypothetical protein
VEFTEACAILRDEYGTGHHVWASWGEYDRAQVARQCTAAGIRYPFGTRHLNVKILYSLVNALDRELGMACALEYAGLPLEGTHHRGATTPGTPRICWPVCSRTGAQKVMTARPCNVPAVIAVGLAGASSSDRTTSRSAMPRPGAEQSTDGTVIHSGE